jgi:hypothetical protein
MGIEKQDTPLFVYIVYKRDSGADVDKIRLELANMCSSGNEEKDIILDLTNHSNIYSPEIGFIVRLLSVIKGSARYLRLIVNYNVKKSLEATQIEKIPNLVIYNNRQEFTESLKKLKAAQGSVDKKEA